MISQGVAAEFFQEALLFAFADVMYFLKGNPMTYPDLWKNNFIMKCYNIKKISIYIYI